MDTKTLKELKAKSKSELIELIKEMTEKNARAQTFLTNRLNHKKPDLKQAIRRLERAFERGDGDIESLYKIAMDFAETTPSKKEALTLLLEALDSMEPWFEAYGGEAPETIETMMFKVYEHACLLAEELKDIIAARKLKHLKDSTFDEDLNEALTDIFYQFFDVDDEEDDVILLHLD